MRMASFVSSAVLCFAVGVAAVAAPPSGKGGGKGGGGEEPSIEVPTTVFIQQAKKGPPSLVVAGSDSSSTQTVYNFANYSAYLHDAVLVTEGHGRALVTDRSENPLPLIVVDFWFNESGVVTAADARLLVERRDWGCEALSSDGTRAIYSPSWSGEVTAIDLASGSSGPLWQFDPALGFTDCDFQSEDPLNGKLHVVVVDNGNYRIDEINIAGGSVRTVVSSRSDEIRQLAVHYSGSSIARVAFDDPSGIRIGSSFGNAASNEVAVPDGRYPDFYCDGMSLLGRGIVRNNRPTITYDLQTGSTEIYADRYVSRTQTLC